jgi:small GTP-binding protein
MDKEQDEEDYRLYKILLLGDCAVGKSCLLLRYCENSFQESHLATIGLDFRLKTITLENNRKIRIQIWDTAGEDRFRSITRNYYKGAHGIVLIYDVTDQQSFQHIKDWVDKIKEESKEGVIIYLVGNKIDLIDKRIITNADGKKLSEEIKIKYYETSAKDSIGVNEVFENLVKDMDNFYSEQHQEEMETIHIDKKDKKKRKLRCCKQK